MAKVDAVANRACAHLAGAKLEGTKKSNWEVVRQCTTNKKNTPNGFSVGYIVRNEDGEEAFLKAMDADLTGSPSEDAFSKLDKAMLEYRFERDILDVCRGNNMDRIVNCIDNGEIWIDFNGVKNIVFYLIFELAKCDVRDRVLLTEEYNFAWAMHALHNLSVALFQLHRQGVHHNDVKPANLLEFDETLQKLADLGRATAQGVLGPYDKFSCAGDRRYAAPEGLYRPTLIRGVVAQNTRKSSDLYLLGSMLHYFITGRMTTTTILSDLDPKLHPAKWTGTFEEVLPFWKNQFASVAENLEETQRS